MASGNKCYEYREAFNITLDKAESTELKRYIEHLENIRMNLEDELESLTSGREY